MSGKSESENFARTQLIATVSVPRLPLPGSEGRYREYLGLPMALDELTAGHSEKSPSTMGTLERYDGLQSLVYEVSLESWYRACYVLMSHLSFSSQQLKWR